MIKTHDPASIAEKKAQGRWPPTDVSTFYLSQILALGPKEMTGLEIGTLGGEGACWLLENCPNLKKLYTVDPYRSYHEWIGRVPQAILDEYRETAKQNFIEHGDRVEMHTSCPDVKVDFVFIDGAHDYESVMHDLMDYVPRVKRGGIICGHDYELSPGVRFAVLNYRKLNGITAPMRIIPNDVYVWNVL